MAGAVGLAVAVALVSMAVAPQAPAAASDAAAVSSQAKKKAAKKAAPAAKQGLPARKPFSVAEQDIAAIPGLPGARFWGDSEHAFLQALPRERGPWLALSTGGEDGAFGAGLLGGWTTTGKRPQFALVTGVSTGALIAPFAFLGPKFDDALRDAYTTIGAVDIFEIGGKGESLLDTWPLRELIAKRFTADLLKAIAAEHARGRRLFIITTNLDAGRPMVWDIGAIASRGDQQALDLVRSIMVAAISIPGAFPPALIETEAQGRRIEEMHVDGGLSGQFYIAPDSMLTSTASSRLPASDFYIVVNMKLSPEFAVTDRSILGILGRTVTTAIKFMTRNAVDRVYATAQRSGIGFHLAYVNQGFHAPARGAFDTDYMKALYQAGFAQGSGPAPFQNEPPDFSEQPRKAAR